MMKAKGKGGLRAKVRRGWHRYLATVHTAGAKRSLRRAKRSKALGDLAKGTGKGLGKLFDRNTARHMKGAKRFRRWAVREYVKAAEA